MGSSPIFKNGHSKVNADGVNKDYAGIVLLGEEAKQKLHMRDVISQIGSVLFRIFC